MKILLTGASGFIGQALLPALIARRHQVTLLSRHPSPALSPSVYEILAEPENWAGAIHGKSYDLCLHLAWIATPGVYLESPENNILSSATIALADTLFQAGLGHFLGIGTCIEYAPDQTNPCSEDITPIAPRSIYGQAKEQARVGIAAAAKQHGAGYTWVRLFYPYGKDEHPDRIPSSFLRTLASHQPLKLKTPNSIKDWIEIRDIVSALIHLSEKSPHQCEINLGTGIGTRMADFAKIAAQISNADLSLIQVSDTPTTDPYSYHIADTSKLFATGWRPFVKLEEGLSSLPISSLPKYLYS